MAAKVKKNLPNPVLHSIRSANVNPPRYSMPKPQSTYPDSIENMSGSGYNKNAEQLRDLYQQAKGISIGARENPDVSSKRFWGLYGQHANAKPYQAITEWEIYMNKNTDKLRYGNTNRRFAKSDTIKKESYYNTLGGGHNPNVVVQPKKGRPYKGQPDSLPLVSKRIRKEETPPVGPVIPKKKKEEEDNWWLGGSNESKYPSKMFPYNITDAYDQMMGYIQDGKTTEGYLDQWKKLGNEAIDYAYRTKPGKTWGKTVPMFNNEDEWWRMMNTVGENFTNFNPRLVPDYTKIPKNRQQNATETTQQNDKKPSSNYTTNYITESQRTKVPEYVNYLQQKSSQPASNQPAYAALPRESEKPKNVMASLVNSAKNFFSNPGVFTQMSVPAALAGIEQGLKGINWGANKVSPQKAGKMTAAFNEKAVPKIKGVNNFLVNTIDKLALLDSLYSYTNALTTEGNYTKIPNVNYGLSIAGMNNEPYPQIESVKMGDAANRKMGTLVPTIRGMYDYYKNLNNYYANMASSVVTDPNLQGKNRSKNLAKPLEPTDSMYGDVNTSQYYKDKDPRLSPALNRLLSNVNWKNFVPFVIGAPQGLFDQLIGKPEEAILDALDWYDKTNIKPLLSGVGGSRGDYSESEGRRVLPAHISMLPLREQQEYARFGRPIETRLKPDEHRAIREGLMSAYTGNSLIPASYNDNLERNFQWDNSLGMDLQTGKVNTKDNIYENLKSNAMVPYNNFKYWFGDNMTHAGAGNAVETEIYGYDKDGNLKAVRVRRPNSTGVNMIPFIEKPPAIEQPKLPNSQLVDEENLQSGSYLNFLPSDTAEETIWNLGSRIASGDKKPYIYMKKPDDMFRAGIAGIDNYEYGGGYQAGSAADQNFMTGTQLSYTPLDNLEEIPKMLAGARNEENRSAYYQENPDFWQKLRQGYYTALDDYNSGVQKRMTKKSPTQSNTFAKRLSDGDVKNASRSKYSTANKVTDKYKK